MERLGVMGLLFQAAVPAAGQTIATNIEVGDYISASVVTAATNVVSGHTAFTLMVNPRSDAPKDSGAHSIYAIFGTETKLLTVPPAFHVASPFGADFAGTNPAFWQINADSQWDSWLTVGITQGDPHNLISSIGIDWTTWTADAGLSVDDGAVFWMDPDNAPAFADSPGGVAVGQVTVLPTASAADRCVILSAQGRSHAGEEDWEELTFQFALGAGGCGAAPVRPPPVPPPPPHLRPPPPPPPPVSEDVGCDALETRPGYRVSYRQQEPCPSGRACRGFPESTVAMVTCTPPYQLIKHDGPSRKVLSFAEVQCQHGQWSSLPAACELPAPITTPAHPPPPPPPTPGPSRPVIRPPVNPHSTCTMDTLNSAFSHINDVCCTLAGIECADAAPSTCSTACRDVVLDVWSDCQSVIQQMPAGFTALDEFVNVCSTGNGNLPGGVVGTLDSLKTSDGPALAGGNQMQFSCTYSELTGIALQCSTAASSSVAVFCASQCASQLVPWAAQCASTMQLALDALGLTSTFDSVIGQCNPATDDAHVCPIAQITTACRSFTGMGTNVEAMCATPCVETVVAHYGACSASTDPRVAAEFSSNIWKPIVDTCQSLRDSSHVVGAEINAQCSLIKDAMSAQLDHLCCGGSECITIPDYCPTACSDALLPYFRDCASQLHVDEPVLFGRLTELATVCTSQNGRGGHR